MLPQTYQAPAAILLILGGLVACLAGYRLFKLVLAIYGFILGAGLASSMMGTSNTAGMLAAALGGGIAGALILVFAYFLGIALVGAGLGALVAHLVWSRVQTGDPSPVLVIALAVVGAVIAMILQRYVIIVATAFGGAWTLLVGGTALMVDRQTSHLASSSVWILYPFAPATAAGWVSVAWIALGVVGAIVQLGITAKR